MVVGVFGSGHNDVKIKAATILSQAASNPIVSTNYDPYTSVLEVDEIVEITNGDTLEASQSIKDILDEAGYSAVLYSGDIDSSKYNYVVVLGESNANFDKVCEIISSHIKEKNICWLKDNNGWWGTLSIHPKTNFVVNHRPNGVTKVYCLKDRYMQVGWQDVHMKENEKVVRLYFNPESGELLTGWNMIDNTWYYFIPEIPFIVSKSVVIDGKEYSTNEYGALVGYTGKSSPE